MFEVIGVVRGFTKGKNSPYTKVHAIGSFDDYAVTNGAVGRKAVETYISGIVAVEVGQKIDFVYNGQVYDGRAIVSGVTILK